MPADGHGEGFGSRSLIAAIGIALLIVGLGAFALWPRDDGSVDAETPSQRGVPTGFEDSPDGAVAAGSQLLELTLLSERARPAALTDFVPADSFPTAEGVWSGGSIMAAKVDSASGADVVVNYWGTAVVGDDDHARVLEFFTVRVGMIRSEGEWRIVELGALQPGSPGMDDENSVQTELLGGWWLLDHQGFRAVEISP